MMESWLICSYSPIKQAGFNPSQAKLKYRRVRIIKSSTLLEDSIGGPKATRIRSIPNQKDSLTRWRGSQAHSFVFSEHHQDPEVHKPPKVILSSFSLKLDFPGPISQKTGRDLSGASEENYRNLKFEFVVREESTKDPLVVITQDFVLRRQLLTRNNHKWFEALVGDQRSFEFEFGKDKSASLPEFSAICTDGIIKKLENWLCLRGPMMKCPPASVLRAQKAITHLPNGTQAAECIRKSFLTELDTFIAAQGCLKACIPRLSKDDGSLESNLDWYQIQKAIKDILSSFEIIEFAFLGITTLAGTGDWFQHDSSIRYVGMKKSLNECLEEEPITECKWRMLQRIQRFASCQGLLEKLQDFDFVKVISEIIATAAEREFYQVLEFREFSLMNVINLILLASTSHSQYRSQPIFRFSSKYLPSMNSDLSCRTQMYTNLTILPRFAFAFGGTNCLRIWPRLKENQGKIDFQNQKIFDFPEIQSTLLTYRSCFEHRLVFTAVEGSLGRCYVVDVVKFLENQTDVSSFLKIIDTGEVKGLIWTSGAGLGRDFFFRLQFCQGQAQGNVLVAIVVPLSSELVKRTEVPQESVLDIGADLGKFEVSAYYLNCNSNRVFLCLLDKPDIKSGGSLQRPQARIGCWESVDGTLIRLDLALLPAKLAPQPDRLTARQALSLRHCQGNSIEPIFLESEGNIFYIHPAKRSNFYMYVFWKNHFTPVGHHQAGLHQLPDGFVLIPSTASSGAASLYIAKQIEQDPKTFEIRALQLRF